MRRNGTEGVSMVDGVQEAFVWLQASQVEMVETASSTYCDMMDDGGWREHAFTHEGIRHLRHARQASGTQ